MVMELSFVSGFVGASAERSSFSTYLPITSFSKFTISPTLRSESVVCAAVCGMMETLKSYAVTFATVRLMPSMVMEPFSMIYRSRAGDAEMVYQTAISSSRISRTVPMPSMCPDTI